MYAAIVCPSKRDSPVCLFSSLLRLNRTCRASNALATRDAHDWLPDPRLDRIRRHLAQALQDAAHATKRVQLWPVFTKNLSSGNNRVVRETKRDHQRWMTVARDSIMDDERPLRIPDVRTAWNATPVPPRASTLCRCQRNVTDPAA